MPKFRMKFPMPSRIFLILLSLSVSDLGIGITSVAGQCLQDQKDLLLEFRNNLTYDSSLSTKLVQWDVSTDCCRWAGVKCNAEGHVSGLDLSSESISGGISDGSSSLFRLLFLESLNLAENTFGSIEFPTGFGELTELRYLNLSNSGFSGQIPLDISNLTRLVVLDLSSAHSSVSLENPNLERLIHKLNRLQELDLGGVNVSAKGSDWCHALSSHVPNLRVLIMPNTYLRGPFYSSLSKLQSLSVVRLDGNTFSTGFPGFFADFPQLQVLTMSSCDISGVVPRKLFQINSLMMVDLSNNRDLEGSLPEFPSNGSLQTLQLQYTKFSGNLSDSLLGNLEMLLTLDLRACSFSGTIPSSIRNLTRLEYLDLSLNKFVGPVPSFASLRNLTSINVHHNSLTGLIPDTTWKGLENLEFLDLSENHLEGEIPASLFSLPSVEFLDLSNNSFSGSIRDLTTGSSSPLHFLKLSINNLEGSIPKFLFELQNLTTLSLSRNKFNGSVELADFRKLTGLVDLDLSYNYLSVHVNENTYVSSLFPRLGRLMLASCKMQKIPLLKNQSSLMMLDLSDNQLGGEIPKWIWAVGNGFLRFLNLSHNHFTHLQEPYDLRSVYLDSLILNSNKLGGQIPIPPPSVYYLDLSGNNFSSIPANIGNSLPRAFFVSMANNRIIGTIPPSMCNATKLQILDFSNNRLQGRIPSCLSEKTLNVLNLGRNNLSGGIPDTFPVGCSLQTLDLNRNFLQGEVPKSLERCTELQVLNLGNNELGGPFPCWLKNLSRLRVLVLRSNKFHGNVTCLEEKNTWSNLQIIDIASNNFNGVLPGKLFPILKALLANQGSAQRQLDHLYIAYGAANNVYYQDSVTVTLKGQEVEYKKILNILTSIDFSGNHFQGRIPETIGTLNSLYVLNFSGNALSGHIPASIGNLKNIESLDLSLNNLAGEIPNELARLTFLSVLNLSYNHLVRRIPQGRQIWTFSESSFKGNEGLCGFPLNNTCSELGTPEATFSQPTSEEEDETRDVGLYVSAAMGFAVGVIVIFLPLVVSERWRRGYNRHANKFIMFVLRRQEQNEDW